MIKKVDINDGLTVLVINKKEKNDNLSQFAGNHKYMMMQMMKRLDKLSDKRRDIKINITAPKVKHKEVDFNGLFKKLGNVIVTAQKKNKPTNPSVITRTIKDENTRMSKDDISKMVQMVARTVAKSNKSLILSNNKWESMPLG